MRNLEAIKVKKCGSEKKKKREENRDTYNISAISKECCVCKVVFR